MMEGGCGRTRGRFTGDSMTRHRILVVEDDKPTAESIRLYLEHGGFDVTLAFNGRQALDELESEPPDLVLLDLMLPQIDGREVCRRVRAGGDVPIIMVTARSTEDDRLEGLDLGADDYVTKPFSPRELVARVKTVLRRTSGARSSGPLACGPFTLDLERHVARREGAELALTPREFRLLEAFMRAPGRAITREALVERAFGADYAGLERTVDAHVMNLRRKIEKDPAAPRFLITVLGVGYRFTDGS
jgi:DNA-binding response OmpR family regulator